jgi:predicted nucleic acid-binding protein
MRSAAAATAIALRSDSSVTVVPQTRQAFTASLDLYRERSDKGWSLTDCASFLTIRELGITAALTSDKHIEQAGCIALLR